MTLLLGALAVRDPAKAAAVAVVVAVLLAARARLHRFVRETLSAAELRSALVLAAATLIIWPLLPDRQFWPFDALNPRTIWSVVILVMALGAVGHVAVRVLGTRFGLPIAGLASGFVSSSATIAAMGARAVEDPRLLQPAVAGAVLSTVATIVLIAILVAAISPATLSAIALPLAFATLASAIYGLVFTFALLDTQEPDAPQSGDAFSLKAALLLAFTLAVVLIISAAFGVWLGSRGALAAAAITGLADAHATAVSVASQVATGKIAPRDASLPILVGLSTNTLTKIVLAVTSGSRAFAWRVVPGQVAVVAAAWLGLLVRPW